MTPDLNSMHEMIRTHCSPFVFDSAHANGSTANKNAVCDFFGGPTNVLFAAGSYVAGDNSMLQMYSTSSFNLQNKLAFIALPNDCPNQAKSSVCALPYFVPCSEFPLDSPYIQTLENDCLRELHIRILISCMDGRPIKGIVLELVLAGSGASLSQRFLLRLAQMAVQHDLYFLIDEIMTGGRSGSSLLLLLSQPKEFIERVICVTLGKWLSVGVILYNGKIDRGIYLDDRVRGTSTFIPLTQPCIYLQDVLRSLLAAGDRKAALLAKMKLTEDEVWGLPGLIFCGRARTDSARALKCRFTPLIDGGKFSSFRTVLSPDVTKKSTCEATVRAVSEWVVKSRTFGLPIERSFCHLLFDGPDLSRANSKDILRLLNDINGNTAEANDAYTLPMLRLCMVRLQAAGMAGKKLFGHRRLRGFLFAQKKFNYNE